MESIFKIELEGDEFHLKLGGGIPKNSIVLIEALPGIGKSVLAQRFAYGTLVNGNSVSYISTELPVVGFLNQMDSLRYDIHNMFLSGQLKFISIFPAMRKVEFKENLIAKVLQAKKIFDSDIVVFDTLSEMLVKNDMDLKECFDLVSTFKKIITSGKSIILTADPSTINTNLMNFLRGLSEVHITMEEREMYGNKMYYIIVKRFNGAKGDVEKEIPFKVRAGVGIVIELAS